MQLKLSDYSIFTESFESEESREEFRILYNTRLSTTLLVPDTICQKLLNNDFSNIPQDALKRLEEIEAVVAKSENELQTVIDRNKSVIDKNDDLYYVIQPTANCQLGCNYCGQKHTNTTLSDDFADKVLERIEGKLLAGSYKSLSIGWFGGEPLMAVSQLKAMTKKLKALAEKFNCKYSAQIVTNGLSLKEKMFQELVQECNIKLFEVTLDGDATHHDKRRHTKSGVSTFDLILSNIVKIANLPEYDTCGAKISIRCNVDARNESGVTPLLNILAQHNLQDKVSFYAAPIHSWGNDAHKISLTKEEFATKEIDWIIEQFSLGFKPGLVPKVKNVVCMSVLKDSEIVDANGDTYNCTEIPYVDAYLNSEYVLGNMKQADKPFGERLFQDFNDRIASGEQSPCSTCKMLPVCGGSCPKSWKEGIMACPSNKFNIKDKLLLYNEIYPNAIERIVA